MCIVHVLMPKALNIYMHPILLKMNTFHFGPFSFVVVRARAQSMSKIKIAI